MSKGLQYCSPASHLNTMGISQILMPFQIRDSNGNEFVVFFGGQYQPATVSINVDDDKTSVFRDVDIFSSNKIPSTTQSSFVKNGLLQESIATLISEEARNVLGTAGLKRLENFFRLKSGWDGRDSKPINLSSVEAFSDFFTSTSFCPKRLGIFMSGRGNVVVNWLDQHEHLTELEFEPSSVDYFIERNGEEGTVPRNKLGFSKLFNVVEQPFDL
ncbi:MAG: hypothetical protein AB7C98_04775 [Acidithiobacillus sp.]